MPHHFHQETDIIIIGSGAAGLSAAIEAREAGASVAVFEKMKISGGNTRISDGCLSAAGNFLQKRRGVDDSPELFYQDLLRAGLGLNHPELARILAEKAAEAIDWTRELGVRYLERLDRFGGHSVARGVTIRNNAGVDIVKAQVRRLKELGVEVRTRCRLTRILTDETGAVIGVGIRSEFDQLIRARRAVVLATGGFGNDVAFRMMQNPALGAAVETTNHKGATAEGMIAALGLRAAPVHLSWIQVGPWACADEKGYGVGARLASYAVYPAGILVDPASGRRIVNEWGDRRQRGDAILAAGHPCVGIIDAAGAKLDPESLAQCLKSGKARRFESLWELAAAHGMPPDALEETVADYNRAIGEGSPDPLGKPIDAGTPPVAALPYYAIRLWPKVHYTAGGVAINARARVLDLNGRPIPGLFAAGEVTGGIHGASRLGGCALPECIVFGRIAGAEAAAQAD